MSVIVAVLVFVIVVLVFQNNILKGKFDKFGQEIENSNNEKNELTKRIAELEVENKTLLKLMKN